MVRVQFLVKLKYGNRMVFNMFYVMKKPGLKFILSKFIKMVFMKYNSTW